MDNIKTFPGGYKFKGFMGQPKDELVVLDVPSKVIIPLFQIFGMPPKLTVNAGDSVSAGQIIARDDDKISSPVHSSVNGKVIAIEKKNYYNRETTMVVIESESTEEYQKVEGYSPEWEKLSAEKIEEVLYKSGVTALDREGIPTRFKTSIIGPDEVEDLIIHASESEIYNLSLDVILSGKNLYNFVEGIKILQRIMPKAKVHLVVNGEKKALLEKLNKLASNLDNFRIYSVVAKYPQGYEEMLISNILGKKFPYGYSASTIGVVALNIQAVLHTWEAVVEGKPLIERTVALCGPSFKENLHVRVKVGTPLEFVIKDKIKEGPFRVVANSLLTGFELKDLSLAVDRTFSQIIAIPDNKERDFFAFMKPGIRSDSYSKSFLSAFLKTKKTVDTNLKGEERACIQCGYCISACPVRINPTMLDRISRYVINDTLMRYGIFNCIDCNLCSYVCPSKISVAKHLKTAKEKLIESGCDNSLCVLPKFNLKGLEEYKGIKVTR